MNIDQKFEVTEELQKANPQRNVIMFFNNLYDELYKLYINSIVVEKPYIDFDLIKPTIKLFLNNLNDIEVAALQKIGVNGKSVNKKEWLKSCESKSLMVFLWHYPYFTDLLLNIHPLSAIVVKSYETIHNTDVTTDNFIKAKQWIDLINRARWNRQQTTDERQSGVSNLGSVSELLLEKAFSEKLDGINFFKTANQKNKSYGDFVLMCLPNNLWLSVKSNFAREAISFGLYNRYSWCWLLY